MTALVTLFRALVRVRERYDRSGDGVYIECYGRSGRVRYRVLWTLWLG